MNGRLDSMLKFIFQKFRADVKKIKNNNIIGCFNFCYDNGYVITLKGSLTAMKIKSVVL